MKVGIPKEIKNNENRVGMTPAGVAELTHRGHEVSVQHTAGEGSGFSDDEYMNVFEYIVPLQLLAYRTYSGKGIDLNTRNYPRIGDKVPTKAKALERK